MRRFGDKIYQALSDSWLAEQMRAITANGSARPAAVFRSARIKLTIFYFAIIAVFAIILTLGVLGLAEHEFARAGLTQQGEVQHEFAQFYSVPPESYFDQIQVHARRLARHRLDNDVIIVDIIAIFIGGILSYWYAGRTLRPIEESNRAQARFAADASHELRTPLAAMQTENEVFLHAKKFTNSEARQLIASNLEEVQRLENLAGTLLMLTAYEQTKLDFAKIEAEQIIDAALKPLQKSSESKQIKFVKKLQAGSLSGNFDSLAQLAGIILDNAIKYGPAGSKVFIDGVVEGNCYSLTIRDAGPGIDAQDLPYIFDRLYRGDKARGSKVGGYGLGLSLAREIALANNGQISAANHPAGGAELSLKLPLAKS
ncbi:MAG: sensor histidine kinase [Candidatus Saccharimonadales bacterium]